MLIRKGIKNFLEKLKFLIFYLHFLLKNGPILRVRNNKLADKDSQMTIAFFMLWPVLDWEANHSQMTTTFGGTSMGDWLGNAP